MKEFRRILAAIDGAPITQTIIDMAGLLARTHQASVTLLYVREEQILMTALAVRAGAPPLEEPTTYGANILHNGAATLRARGIRTAVEYRMGDAGVTIVQEARHGTYDLIVLGSVGQGMLHRLLRGSACDYVVNRAPCPVLVARPDSPLALRELVASRHGDENGRTQRVGSPAPAL